jgi:hypothetical protein
VRPNHSVELAAALEPWKVTLSDDEQVHIAFLGSVSPGVGSEEDHSLDVAGLANPPRNALYVLLGDHYPK